MKVELDLFELSVLGILRVYHARLHDAKLHDEKDAKVDQRVWKPLYYAKKGRCVILAAIGGFCVNRAALCPN